MVEIEITKACEVKVRDVEWLRYPCISYAKIRVVQGDAGNDKGTFLISTAAMLSLEYSLLLPL